MNAMTGSFVPAPEAGRPMPAPGRAQFEPGAADALAMKWAALRGAAGVVAMLAGLQAAPLGPQELDFPVAMHRVGGLRLAHAEQGIDDLFAVMEIGLKALLEVSARGGNPAAGALALWQEFESARAALLDLAPAPSPRLPG